MLLKKATKNWRSTHSFYSFLAAQLIVITEMDLRFLNKRRGVVQVLEICVCCVKNEWNNLWILSYLFFWVIVVFNAKPNFYRSQNMQSQLLSLKTVEVAIQIVNFLNLSVLEIRSCGSSCLWSLSFASKACFALTLSVFRFYFSFLRLSQLQSGDVILIILL